MNILDVQLDSICYCLLNNNNIFIFDSSYYTGDSLALYNKMREIYDSYGYINFNTYNTFLKEDSKLRRYYNIFNEDYIFSYTLEDCIVILSREYNRRIFIEMINDKSLLTATDERIMSVMLDIINKFRSGRSYSRSISDSFDEMVRYIVNVGSNRYRIGLRGIDDSISIEPDRFIVIGGASGSGKTAFSVFLINRLCELYSDKINILFISLEMSEIRVMMRFISLLANKPISEIKKINDAEYFYRYKDVIKKYSLSILYSTMDINKLSIVVQTHINESKRMNKVPVIFIDHFGEISGLDEYTAKSNTDKITAISKDIARQGGICFGLTQLRKDLLDKKNESNFYKPNNSYIMNSQSVEARADIIMHLWRPEYHNIKEIIYEERDTIKIIDTRGSICIVNDKNRDDIKGDIWLGCNISTNNFYDMPESKIKIINKY